MTHYTGNPYMEFMAPEMMNVHIRIDNIPQGKDWKQVRYFLSRFVLRNQILNIKVLPSMPTMTPPFIPITSCVCVLSPSVDWNSLLMQLNGFQWEYHTLGAILLPPPAMTAPPPPHPRSRHMGIQGSMPAGPNISRTNPHLGLGLQGSVGGQVPSGSTQRQRTQTGGTQQHQQPRKLKQLFNETSFRKQMSSRSMYQIKFSNFPPCLHWDEIVKFKSTGIAGQHVTRASDTPSLLVRTNEPEVYGKLKWTMLKDFIKKECPELFENTSSFEFYVGVYESGELDVEIQLCEGMNEEIAIQAKASEEHDATDNDAIEGITEGIKNIEVSEARTNDENDSSPEQSDKNGTVTEDDIETGSVKDTSPTPQGNGNGRDMADADANIEKYMVKATNYEAVVGFVNYDKFLKCLQTFQGKEFSLGHKLSLEALESVEPN